MLSARSIGEKAERATLSLALAHGTVFEAFYSYVFVDEPAVHLMPLHFLPVTAGCVGIDPHTPCLRD